ncbi:hypothetical protein M404DRAFT_30168 [Pisolithus tinctorius Marx 270]|uniref:Uncharacterized protein n=1 Tax=Pisolithus tinctorius Marx 270 TaxID=870435 RepID=A0A0C3IS36_PISTI|nr:hypothetical protein M404DRAFT_30168 [Pisolithus tinctorius Marx 270]
MTPWSRPWTQPSLLSTSHRFSGLPGTHLAFVSFRCHSAAPGTPLDHLLVISGPL